MFQGDGNPNDKKKPTSTTTTTSISEKPYTPPTQQQQYPPYTPVKEVQPPVSQIPPMPYGSMYHPSTMQYPGYMMPQTTYPPSDMYYMPPNMYYTK